MKQSTFEQELERQLSGLSILHIDGTSIGNVLRQAHQRDLADSERRTLQKLASSNNWRTDLELRLAILNNQHKE